MILPYKGIETEDLIIKIEAKKKGKTHHTT